jgi:hypothetical protein
LLAAVIVRARGLLASRAGTVSAGSADGCAGSTLTRAGSFFDIFSVIDGPTATPSANAPINAAVSAVAFPAVIVESSLAERFARSTGGSCKIRDQKTAVLIASVEQLS